MSVSMATKLVFKVWHCNLCLPVDVESFMRNLFSLDGQSGGLGAETNSVTVSQTVSQIQIEI